MRATTIFTVSTGDMETCIEIFIQELSLFYHHLQNISREYRRLFNKNNTMQYTLYWCLSIYKEKKERKERTQTRCSFTIHWFYDIIYGNQTGLLKVTVFSYFIKKRRGFYPRITIKLEGFSKRYAVPVYSIDWIL